MIYSIFAQVYDELMDTEVYENWLTFVNNNAYSGKKLLDLACGAGQLAVMLAKEGYQVTGVDLSSEMLALADERAREDDTKIELVQANMTDLTGLDQFDVVTCGLDSLCYLANQEELANAFRQVFLHLNQGGTFIFDVISPYQTDVIYPGYMYNDTNEKRAFVWESFEGQEPHSVVHDLTFFIAKDEENNLFQRYEETHMERTYELKKYLELLTKVGFKKIRASSEYGNNEIDEKSTRFFFVCQKL
ncbi:class I SAM-dependent DNA methyltransferase [Liquorilactobacillus cacaonum]|uniref:SAM-dependent methyltransferase n=1 Tax=Liquorilactobacillus cacaonum DSM 21116 TaxID=1423729 RepID=A0A0R2CHM9_9LACO|nr:class I SAM-dependent methyltransferase [Liquorilactobacillus cacaonum]KRM90626.1 SAM-dependent methyltransferase [Liquorilactobacillus cacaonum DSM 21116]